MKLEYVNFKEGDAFFGAKKIRDEQRKRDYVFSPFGTVPDELGERILKQLPNEFRKVEEPKAVETPPEAPKPTFKCDVCEFVGKSQMAVKAHKRFKHKEATNEATS